MSAPGKKKLCPYCEEEIPVSATICRHCREELPDASGKKKKAKKAASPLDAQPGPEKAEPPKPPSVSWEDEDGPATYTVKDEPETTDEDRPRKRRPGEEEDEDSGSKKKHPSIVDQYDEDAQDRRRGKKSRFAHCPSCGSRDSRRVHWTLWGSFWGPLILCHVRCNRCNTSYNGRTGELNTTGVVIFLIFDLLLTAGLGVLGFLIYQMTQGG